MLINKGVWVLPKNNFNGSSFMNKLLKFASVLTLAMLASFENC